MSEGKKQESYEVGDKVRVKLGLRTAHGVVVENRGAIGAGGRTLYRVGASKGGRSQAVELPADELRSGRPAAGESGCTRVTSKEAKVSRSRSVYKREDGKWMNKRDDSSKAGSVHDTQGEAVSRAREMLGKSGGGELVVHGRIRSKDTISPGRDPFPPRDTEH